MAVEVFYHGLTNCKLPPCDFDLVSILGRVTFGPIPLC